ncbi:hypothetical protein [Dyadobacter luticola]|uniref:Uncharacterized protein n=1 Tax=Dyadobacter luticola TaxID=1979387 RepID=A0A5R9KT41_9BACT|nr:hypothetical protein [Dyadobacter luticola]TLU99268.1 hypothetical protein FEN17_22115 [Dyadobacter luticola]
MNIATLRNCSLGYLLAPNIVFALAWFRPHISIPVVLCFACLFYIQFKKGPEAEEHRINVATLGWLLAAAAFWTFCTGMGGLSYQIADYFAHNAKFHDLYRNPWPTYFADKQRYACYYFGFFLIPAGISKLVGHISIPALLFWAVLGYWLVLQWLFILLKKHKRLIFFFLMLGGVGHLVKVTFYQIATSYSYHIATFYLEIWSLFDQSLWVTSQVIPILLVSSILVSDSFIKNRVQDSFFPITLCFMWAIFPSIVFVLLFSMIFINKCFGNWKDLFSLKTCIPLIVAGLAFLPIFIFLRSSDSLPVNGFIWQFEPVGEIFAEYFFGVIVDLILIFIIIKNLKNVDNLIPRWFTWCVMGLFLLISLYRIGHWNDWFVRGYNPLLAILLFTIVRSLHTLYQTGRWKKNLYYNVVVGIFALSMLIPVGHIFRALKTNVLVSNAFPDKFPFEPMRIDKYPNTYQALFQEASNPKEADQYLGKKDSFYARYLARESR